MTFSPANWFVRATAAIAAFSACAAPQAGDAKVNLDTDSAFKSIDIVERLGDQIPTDLNFVDETGQAVKLADLVAGDLPVILTLNYYECPMLCTLELNGMVKGLRELDYKPGEQYRIVTVSIDPEETPELAANKAAHYRKSLADAPVAGWQFLTGQQEQITELSKSVGFNYFYDYRRDEWAHAACVFVLTPEGRISRYLYGIEFRPKDLKLALLEASEGTIGSVMDRVLLFCFHYDPQGKKYAIAAIRVMRGGGALTLLLLGGTLFVFWRRERRKSPLLKPNTDGAAA